MRIVLKEMTLTLGVLLIVEILSARPPLVRAECKKCDVETLTQTEKNIKNLQKKDILCFLLTFDDSCKTNVEYTEYSNKLLFQVIQLHTQAFVELLSQNRALKKQCIYLALETPVLDYDIKGIIHKVASTKANDKVKSEIVSHLKIAENQN